MFACSPSQSSKRSSFSLLTVLIMGRSSGGVKIKSAAASANDNHEVEEHHLNQNMMLRHSAKLVAIKGNNKSIFRSFVADWVKAVR
jgi:hypothetical protein